MSDHNSAEIFGLMFQLLADGDISDKDERIARSLWRLQRQYDFHPCQMEANEALERLLPEVISRNEIGEVSYSK